MKESKTTIDWLRFRAKEEPPVILRALRPMFGDLANFLKLDTGEKGILGFKQAARVMLLDMPIGRMDYGGDSQRDWVRVDLSGKACEWVRDWDAAESVEELPNAQIRRLDIALTTWHGEVTHDVVVAAHAAGLFNGEAGGVPPELRQITSSNERAGRTCYIGSRTSQKFLRAYEKGFQMVANSVIPEGMKKKKTNKNQTRIEEIYRVEMECKATKLFRLPWGMIRRRDEYFAGAYRFNAQLLPEVEPDILQRDPRLTPKRELAAFLELIKHQYGKVLYTALTAHKGDVSAIWDRIVGKEDHPGLVEAGVLMVEHDDA